MGSEDLILYRAVTAVDRISEKLQVPLDGPETDLLAKFLVAFAKDEMVALTAERDRYKQALEHYADEATWVRLYGTALALNQFVDVGKALARQALEQD